MSRTRVTLLHWKPEEAEPKLKLLESAGFSAQAWAPKDGRGIAAMTAGSEAVLIDLSRLPLQGRAAAIELRKRAQSRATPIVFVGGAPEKVDAIRKIMPDAGYIEWRDVPGGLTRAIKSAPRTPLVVDTMAGYSGSSLPKKLGIREGTAFALLQAPPGFESQIAPLPEGARVTRKPAEAQRVVLFVLSRKDFEERWASTTEVAAKGATIWIAWPKKASGIATDLSETNIRAYGLANGWVDYKVCAIDQTWSGLAFTRRKKAR